MLRTFAAAITAAAKGAVFQTEEARCGLAEQRLGVGESPALREAAGELMGGEEGGAVGAAKGSTEARKVLPPQRLSLLVQRAAIEGVECRCEAVHGAKQQGVARGHGQPQPAESFTEKWHGFGVAAQVAEQHCMEPHGHQQVLVYERGQAATGHGIWK